MLTPPHKFEATAAALGIVVSVDGKTVFRADGSSPAIWILGGYPTFSCGPKSNRKNIRIHRMQAWTKYGDAMYAEGMVCRHLDGNPLNAHRDNIVLGTQSQNQHDRLPGDLHRHAWAASRHVLKYDHHAVIEHYKQFGFKSAMAEFGIRSKGTLSHIINHTQTATPVLSHERPSKRAKTGRFLTGTSPASS